MTHYGASVGLQLSFEMLATVNGIFSTTNFVQGTGFQMVRTTLHITHRCAAPHSHSSHGDLSRASFQPRAVHTKRYSLSRPGAHNDTHRQSFVRVKCVALTRTDTPSSLHVQTHAPPGPRVGGLGNVRICIIYRYRGASRSRVTDASLIVR